MDLRYYETVVVGSGIAGLMFALKVAQRGSVAIVTKKQRWETNTSYAQGGIACVTSEEDSFDFHVEDTLEVGCGLSKPDVVRSIVEAGPERIKGLIELGMQFTEREQGEERELDLHKEGGHSKRRILHSKDVTGREIERALLKAVAENSNITVYENHIAIDLITKSKLGYSGDDRCVGLYVLDRETKKVETLGAFFVLLGTGGCGKTYLYTTNPDIATGDGVAMAYRAGAPVANMEFIQFHPTCLYHHRVKSFLISEAVRGEGGELVDARGQPFMYKYHARKSLAPRDVVARAIDAEMKRTGAKCMFLDITHKPADFVRDSFPNIYETCLKLGIDMTQRPIPVVPAAHYQCGGVQTDLDGRTALAGLYAVGEVACTGLHGANRLASNSLLEALVVSHRAAEHVLAQPKGQDEIALETWKSGKAQDADELVVIYHNWREIRQLMWDYVSIVRTTKRLKRAGARLRLLAAEVQDFYWNYRITPDLIELRNLVLVASLIVDSALRRRESRGLHYMLDYPDKDEARAARDTVLHPPRYRSSGVGSVAEGPDTSDDEEDDF